MFILSEWVFPKLEALAPKPQGPAVRFRKKKHKKRWNGRITKSKALAEKKTMDVCPQGPAAASFLTRSPRFVAVIST